MASIIRRGITRSAPCSVSASMKTAIFGFVFSRTAIVRHASAGPFRNGANPTRGLSGSARANTSSAGSTAATVAAASKKNARIGRVRRSTGS